MSLKKVRAVLRDAVGAGPDRLDDIVAVLE